MAVDGFEYEISWSKFKKLTVRPQGSDGDGYTYAVYQSNNIQPERGKGNAIIVKSADIVISLDSNQSWVVEGKMNDALLKHEQGHYDITALGARELYKGLMKLKAKDVEALTKSVKDLSEACQKKIDLANKRYDEQTDHSQIQGIQEKWNKAIVTEKQKQDGSLDNLPL